MLDYQAILGTFDSAERNAMADLLALAYSQTTSHIDEHPLLQQMNHSHCLGALRFHYVQAIFRQACENGQLACECGVERQGSTDIIRLCYPGCVVLVKHVNEKDGAIHWRESAYQRQARDINAGLWEQATMPFYHDLPLFAPRVRQLPVVTLLHGHKELNHIELAIFANADESHQRLASTGNFAPLAATQPVEAVEAVLPPQIELRFEGEEMRHAS